MGDDQEPWPETRTRDQRPGHSGQWEQSAARAGQVVKSSAAKLEELRAAPTWWNGSHVSGRVQVGMDVDETRQDVK